MEVKPAPLPGMVIRYDYLWHRERRAGRAEGAKDRPCAIILTVAGEPMPSVIVAAVTHAPPLAGTDAIAMPPAVKRHLGLDDSPSWIVTSEVNIVPWDDPGIVPVDWDQWIYGILPPKLTRALSGRVAAHYRERKLGTVER
jgi:hypothetical protein